MSHENPPSTRPTPPGQPPGPGTEPPVKHRPEMSLTQIVGGALAAMTAAALGSRLGVGGTIIGAAVVSIVAAVASALYTASLRTTREKVKTTLWAGRPHQSRPTAVSSPLPWKRIAGGALAAFALAAVALTGVELLTGTALSGGDGTTISQVGNERAGRTRLAPARSTASPSEQASDASSADSSTEPSTEPTDDATPTTSPAPSALESAAEPSTVPREQTTTEPSAEPSAEPTTDPSPGDR